MNAEEVIARAFHDAYERAAAGLGWETQERSRVPWEDVPEANRKTMLSTVGVLIEHGVIRPGPAVTPERQDG